MSCRFLMHHPKEPAPRRCREGRRGVIVARWNGDTGGSALPEASIPSDACCPKHHAAPNRKACDTTAQACPYVLPQKSKTVPFTIAAPPLQVTIANAERDRFERIALAPACIPDSAGLYLRLFWRLPPQWPSPSLLVSQPPLAVATAEHVVTAVPAAITTQSSQQKRGRHENPPCFFHPLSPIF
jgi:hypothetical protein